MAHLPGAVHFVAQAPELDIKGRFRAVFAPQVAPIAAGGMVGVFDDVARRVGAARTEIDGVHNLRISLLHPVDKFVQADFVRFRGEPGEVEPAGALAARADAVFPVEAGNEVAARIAHDGHAEPAHHVDDVAAESVFVRRGVAGLIDAAVYGTSEVFNEGAVQPRVDAADGKVAVEDHAGFFHGETPP